MKNLSFFFPLVIFTLLSCSGPNRHDYINETYTVHKDTMLIKCAELKGLGNLIINKTRYQDIKQSNVNYTHKYDSFSSVWGVYVHEKNPYLNKHKTIKQVNLWQFTIGDIQFSTVALAFYNDILVAISFSQNEIVSHYIDKYGNGDGNKYENNYVYEDYSKDHYDKHEEHTWYNQSVQMTYKYRFNNKSMALNIYNEFIISDRTGRYDEFIATMRLTEHKYLKDIESERQKSFSML